MNPQFGLIRLGDASQGSTGTTTTTTTGTPDIPAWLKWGVLALAAWGLYEAFLGEGGAHRTDADF